MVEASMLLVPRLRARLDVRQVAQLLGFAEHDVPILIRYRMLKPLGNPAPNGHKFFPASEIEALAKDTQWLDKATKTVSRHWQGRNQKRKIFAEKSDRWRAQ